eukprot:jgi/Chrpa1/9561/Chrysochromulina_OHIO_Genome00016708-RA
MGDAPKYTIASRKVQTKPDDASPGPIYSPRMESALEQSPQYSFGNSKRFEAGGTFPPGPGQYESLSTRFGGSLVGDAPKYGFGTSVQRPSSEHKKGQRVRLACPSVALCAVARSRLIRSRLRPHCSFISKEHAIKSNYGVNSPGPVAYSFQARAHRASRAQPKCPIGSAHQRVIDSTTLWAKLPTGTIGAQLCGTSQANSPRYTIRPRLEGSATAAAAERDRPGPGKYNQPPAFGNQVASTRNSSANYSFGTSERHNPATNPNRVPYIGKDFDKVYFGVNSPGPSKYAFGGSIGATLPDKKTSSKYSFGGESRFAY